MISSNVMLDGIQSMVRQEALQSFEFFANTVMCSMLPEELCTAVEDIVKDQEDAFVETKYRRSLMAALFTWLSSQGYNVLTSASVPRHEVLHWLELGTLPDGERVLRSVILDLCENGVRVSWV